MSISPGTKLGRYEIRAQLGAGGMGEVYRARRGKDGKELFYLSPDRKIVAVLVNGGATFESGAPVPLFQT